jgi:uncharacterized protein (DUF1810 family)
VTDPHNLQRFVTAQDPVYEQVVAELAAGQKRSHWMWFTFPQIRGLGSSPMADRFAIASRDEARAYSDHPILGARLRQCTELVINVQGRTIEQIFGYPDHLKFRSSMTLFMSTADEKAIFERAIDKYFDGEPDQRTLESMRA